MTNKIILISGILVGYPIGFAIGCFLLKKILFWKDRRFQK